MLLPFFFGIGIAVGPGTVVSSAGLEDVSNNAKRTVPATSNGSPQQHTDPNDGEDEHGQPDSDGN